jgi:hypothetical protein
MMMKIYSNILVASEGVCKNIEQFYAYPRGFISQNLLIQLRNFNEIILLNDKEVNHVYY